MRSQRVVHGLTTDQKQQGHHRLSGHEFEQALGDGEGQGSLVCCSPWNCRVRPDLATEHQHGEKEIGNTGERLTHLKRLFEVLHQPELTWLSY